MSRAAVTLGKLIHLTIDQTNELKDADTADGCGVACSLVGDSLEGPRERHSERQRAEAGAGAKESGGKEGDVVDADFEMVDDDKKKT
jgi:hypothetical protein